MPRSAARERSHHAAVAPERCATFHAFLVAQLPQFDRALVGYPAIIAFLDSLTIQRGNGRPIRVRMLQRWRTHFACPILPGARTARGAIVPPLTTTYLLTAWIASRLHDPARPLFSVGYPLAYRVTGKAPRENSRQCPPGAA